MTKDRSPIPRMCPENVELVSAMRLLSLPQCFLVVSVEHATLSSSPPSVTDPRSEYFGIIGGPFGDADMGLPSFLDSPASRLGCVVDYEHLDVTH